MTCYNLPANKPSQEVIAALWGSVRHKELNYEYVDGFRESLLSCNEDYQIQEVRNWDGPQMQSCSMV